MKTLKSLTALSLGALCLAFNTQVIAKEATPAKTTQATQQVTKASDNIDKYLAININLQIPFVQLAEDARKVFMNQQEKIDVYPIERVILFGDKTVLSDR